MAYEVVMPYHLHMPSYFLETFTEYPDLIGYFSFDTSLFYGIYLISANFPVKSVYSLFDFGR